MKFLRIKNFIHERYSWQENKAEVEFLIEIDGKAIPIEVKSGSVTKAKSLSIFSGKYTPPFQIIFSGKPFPPQRDPLLPSLFSWAMHPKQHNKLKILLILENNN